MTKQTKDAERYQSAGAVTKDKHRLEINVREIAQWLQTIVDSVGDGLISTDTKGCVEFMNPAAERLTGWDQADAIGKPLDKVFHIIDAITRKVAENPALQVINTGQAIRSPDNTVLINRDRIEIPIKNSSTPVITNEAELTGVVLIFQDNTQSHLSEYRIRNSNARLQLAMESANEGMWELNPVTQNMHFDDFCFRMLGFESSDALDHRRWWFTRIHEDDRAQVQKALLEIVDKPDKNLNIDYRLLCKNGRYLWVNSKAKFITNGASSANRSVVGIQRDISSRIAAQKEKKQLESQLNQSRKMEAIGTLASGIAHDFNNILSAVIGYTELSMHEAKKESRLHNYLNKILVAGLRAKDLTGQILMFSRHAEPKPKLKPIELTSLIKETVKLTHGIIPSNIDIKCEMPDTPVTVAVNPTQIHQVVANLCTNGLHSMEGKNGILKIQLNIIHLEKTTKMQHRDLPPGGYACIVVRDNGKGIAPKDMERIFDPYFTTKDQDSGTGLGLSIVRGIVESHNGFITVESLLEHGTAFSVYLPLANGDTHDSEETEFNSLPRGSELILVVDNEPIIAEMQEQRLKLLGYKVEVMTDPTEALLHFKEVPHRYDLIITDMIMPKMSGDELIGKLKAIRPDVRVILCTGYSEIINRQEIQELGIDGFLLKPMEMTTMARLIYEVMGDKTGKKQE